MLRRLGWRRPKDFDCCVLANARRLIIWLGPSVAWKTERQRDRPLSARVGVAQAQPGSTRGIKTQNPSTSEQRALHVLAMELLLRFFTSLLLDLLAHDFCIAVTAYRTDAISCGPTCATPQSLFDRRHAGQYRSGRQTFAQLDKSAWTRARDGLHKKMDRLFGGANLSKDDLLALGSVQADGGEPRVALHVTDDTSILGRTHDVGDQSRDLVPLMTIVAHKSDYHISEKAAASFEESDPQRLNF